MSKSKLRQLRAPATIYPGIGTKAETGVRNGWYRARDLNLHLDSTYAWIQPIPGFEGVDVCDGIPPPLPPLVRHPGLGPVFTRPKRS